VPDLWRCRVVSTQPRLSAEGWLTSTPTPTGGGGGHEMLTLPKRRPVVVWKNAGLWVMSFDLTFDSYMKGESVADEYADLVRMWRPLEEEDEPPTVKLDAVGDVVPMQHLSWVVTGLDWGAAEGNASGNRARQTFTVTVTEWNPDERLDFTPGKSSPSKKRRSKNKRKSGSTSGHASSVKVKAGDTLSEIAQRNDVKGGWQALARAQRPPITDPRSIRVGQTLRLP
jgi:hypothetical protein